MNIIIPLVNPLYLDKLPYPIKVVGDKMIIEWSLMCLQMVNESSTSIYIIVHEKEEHHFNLGEIVKRKILEKYEMVNIEIIVIDTNTKGASHTCQYAYERIGKNNIFTVIYNPNIYFEPYINLGKIKKSFCVFTVKSNNPQYSFAKLTDDKKTLLKTREKLVISKYALLGVYGFTNFELFKKFNDLSLNASFTNNTSFTNNNKKVYISEIYNSIINNSHQVTNTLIELVYSFRNSTECQFFNKKFCYNIFSKPICLACDHSGYTVKKEIEKYLKHNNIKCIDFGCYSDNDCDYNDYVDRACKSIINGNSYIGFGVCRTGQGVNICANKNKGIISALIYSDYAMEMAIQHNGANFFCIPANMFNIEKFKHYIELLKNKKFLGGRFQRRISKLE